MEAIGIGAGLVRSRRLGLATREYSCSPMAASAAGSSGRNRTRARFRPPTSYFGDPAGLTRTSRLSWAGAGLSTSLFVQRIPALARSASARPRIARLRSFLVLLASDTLPRGVFRYTLRD